MKADNASVSSPASLTGKRVLVTGGSSGIGRAIAVAAAGAGADVALTYWRNAAGAAETASAVRQAGREALVLQADVGSPAGVDQLAGAAAKALGRVDAWINNAGADVLTGPGAGLARLEKLDLLLRVDLRGTMLASWAAAGLMQTQPEGGCIINMSWDRALQGLAGENPELFGAVKGGILGFSRALARSLAPRIRVNVLAPGWIETAFGAEAPDSFRRRVTEGIPLQRWGTPEDVAGAAVYLASDAARFLTGQTLLINGGDVM
jgi:3-oxoacyl-[acyl-carrier protein] reductase